MASLNIASLMRHIDELRALLIEQNFDLIAINETRIDSTITDNLVHIDGCNICVTRLALASVLGPFGTFAEIHSTHPGALMHYSRFQSPVVNPDSSLPVRSPVDVYRPWENTRDLPVFIL